MLESRRLHRLQVGDLLRKLETLQVAGNNMSELAVAQL